MSNGKILQSPICSETDDLEQLLDAELAKPAEEIDSDLVDRILDALGAPEPTPEQVEASWRTIKERFAEQRG